jgi:hypothetical protein
MRPWLLRADQCRTLTLRFIEERLKLPPRLWRLAIDELVEYDDTGARETIGHFDSAGCGATRTRCSPRIQQDSFIAELPTARSAIGVTPMAYQVPLVGLSLIA